jgi:hypothetical protein
VPLNREWVLWNLREAKEELDRTILEIEGDAEYDGPELWVAMAHLYQHLNTAWNARSASEPDVRKCSQANYDRWRRMPEDIVYDDE